jgi:UDP-glucose 4-epimerase
MAGCDAVVHAAASVYAKLPWDRLHELNVGGTGRVFLGAVGAGVLRGVHISSVAVYSGLSGPVDEDTAESSVAAPRGAYGRSKREAEEAVRHVARESELRVALLRPPVVYGERDRLFTPRLARVLRLPVHPILGGGRTPMPTVYAGNLAAAVRSALSADFQGGTRAFNVSGDHPAGQRALLGGLARHLGLPFRPVGIPGFLVRGGARLGDIFGRRVPGLADLRFRRVAEVAMGPDPYRSERARSELGWEPPFSLEEALARTAGWIAEEWKKEGKSRGKGLR